MVWGTWAVTISFARHVDLPHTSPPATASLQCGVTDSKFVLDYSRLCNARCCSGLQEPDAAQGCKSRRCGCQSISHPGPKGQAKKRCASNQPPRTGVRLTKLLCHTSLGATVRRKVGSFATAMNPRPRTFRFTISIWHAAIAGKASNRIRSATSLGSFLLVS
jgi:hypothetical protein